MTSQSAFESAHGAYQNAAIDRLGDIPEPWEPDYFQDGNGLWRETGTGRYVGEKEIKEYQRRERA